MFPNAKALLVIVSGALAVYAQSDASTTTSAAPSQSSIPATLDDCILGCVTPAAASAGCSSYADLTCVCTSTAFQQAALSCLQANCTAADVQTATSLQAAECASLSSGSVPASTPTSTGATSVPASVSASASVPSVTSPSTSSKSSSTATSAGSSSTPSSTSSSAAMALGVPFSFGTLVGTLVASAGALLGAAFVL